MIPLSVNFYVPAVLIQNEFLLFIMADIFVGLVRMFIGYAIGRNHTQIRVLIVNILSMVKSSTKSRGLQLDNVCGIEVP